MKNKSIPGAVLGIIGAVLAIIAGIALALCAEVVDAATDVATVGEAGTSYAWMAYVFGIGGGVVALVGAILDFKNNIIGGILLAIATVLLIVLCIIFAWSILLIIAIILIGLGAILSFVVKKPIQ